MRRFGPLAARSRNRAAAPTSTTGEALIPAFKVADATGWPAGMTPAAAPGLKVNAFAAGLDHPRWMYVLANGDVLVAESASPGTDPGRPASRACFFKMFLKKAARRSPSANRITLLRDIDGDGIAEIRSTLSPAFARRSAWR